MGNGQDSENRLWDAIGKIHDDMAKTREHVTETMTKIEGKVELISQVLSIHTGNKEIHHKPPCRALWCLVTLLLGSIIALAWSLLA